jgi:hypothetical protein
MQETTTSKDVEQHQRDSNITPVTVNTVTPTISTVHKLESTQSFQDMPQFHENPTYTSSTQTSQTIHSISSNIKNKNIHHSFDENAMIQTPQLTSTTDEHIKDYWRKHYQQESSRAKSEPPPSNKPDASILTLEHQYGSKGSSYKLAQKFAMPASKIKSKADAERYFSPKNNKMSPSGAFKYKEQLSVQRAKCFNQENLLFALNLLPQLGMVAYSGYEWYLHKHLVWNISTSIFFGSLCLSALLVKYVCCREIKKPLKIRTGDIPSKMTLHAKADEDILSKVVQPPSKRDDKSTTLPELPSNVAVDSVSTKAQRGTPISHQQQSSLTSFNKPDILMFQAQQSVSFENKDDDMADFVVYDPELMDDKDTTKQFEIRHTEKEAYQARRTYLPVSKRKSRENALFFLALLTEISGLGYGIFKLYTEFSSQLGLIFAIAFSALLIAAFCVRFLETNQLSNFCHCVFNFKRSRQSQPKDDVSLEMEITPRSIQ